MCGESARQGRVVSTSRWFGQGRRRGTWENVREDAPGSEMRSRSCCRSTDAPGSPLTGDRTTAAVQRYGSARVRPRTNPDVDHLTVRAAVQLVRLQARRRSASLDGSQSEREQSLTACPPGLAGRASARPPDPSAARTHRTPSADTHERGLRGRLRPQQPAPRSMTVGASREWFRLRGACSRRQPLVVGSVSPVLTVAYG